MPRMSNIVTVVTNPFTVFTAYGGFKHCIKLYLQSAILYKLLSKKLTVEIYLKFYYIIRRNINTVKQLMVVRGGVSEENRSATNEDSNGNLVELAENTLRHYDDLFLEEATEDVLQEHAEFTALFANALKNISLVEHLEIYANSHADEDGIWSVLVILDPKNKEIILIKFGFSGTEGCWSLQNKQPGTRGPRFRSNSKKGIHEI